MNHTSRVVLLIDMDCFYCQVEENLDPRLKGKPIAVVQYNEWRGGGIIAVNYPARERGVTRHMRGNDAKEKCPEIILAKVPQVRGKADLTKYRDAGKRVADVLQTFTPHLERASVDEAYLDITEVVEKTLQDKTYIVNLEKLPNTFVVGNNTADFVDNVTSSREYNESNFKLVIGGIIAEEIRAKVFQITGYKCSAGIAHNKILAKLVCGLHKPDKQTILPHEALPKFYENMPIRKIKSLGGKFGNAVSEKLGIEFMAELVKFNQKELAKKFDEKSACWLYNIARGIDNEPVTTRLISKSIGCCKRFPGKSALLTPEDVEHWLNELAAEMSERLEKDLEENNRKAKQMVISFAQEMNGEEVSGTRTHPLNSYEQRKIFENGLKVIQKNCLKADGNYIVTFLGISVCNFQVVKKIQEITSFFKTMRENTRKEQDTKNPELTTPLHHNHEYNEVNKCDLAKPTSSSTVTQIKNSPKSDSIYSDTTEEEYECNEYVYYEEIKPESITDQGFIDNIVDCNENNNASNTSEDSISQELNFGIPNKQTSTPNSFFSKYFKENVHRDFNTSKILENANPKDLEEDKAAEDVAAVECEKSSQVVNVSVSDEGNINPQSACSECGKTISYFDYQSHMDYHFAINMVKQEAHLYKPECNKRDSTSSSDGKSTKGTKRPKRKENDRIKIKSNPILQLFKTNVDPTKEENSQSCLECNKRIRLDDWEVHRDFHAAKKLHLEMNVKKISPVMPGITLTKPKGQKNIMGFLKPS